MEIVLGAIYVDTLHAIEGVAVSHTRYVTGCDRVMLERKHDGEVKEHWVDVERIVSVDDTRKWCGNEPVDEEAPPA